MDLAELIGRIEWPGDTQTKLLTPMAHTLPDLGYAYDALEPHIDARTMEIHHSKHHQAYITNLNNALAGKPELEAKSLCEIVGELASIPEDIRTAVRNNGGGHSNHSFFWKVIAPAARRLPPANLRRLSTKPSAPSTRSRKPSPRPAQPVSAPVGRGS